MKIRRAASIPLIIRRRKYGNIKKELTPVRYNAAAIKNRGKEMKKSILLPLMMLLLVSLAGCGKEPTIQLTTVYDGETIDICAPEIREYLEAETEEEQAKVLLVYGNSGSQYDYQATSFEWESDGSTSYTVYFADNEKFKDAFTYETSGTFINQRGIFVPGKTYYWKVEGDVKGSHSAVDSFAVEDIPVRYISTASISNVRDIGGWKTEDGQKVKYEMIYRGARTNTITDNSCAKRDVDLFASTLGVRTEIDLRGSDDYGQTESVFGTEVEYVKAQIGGYASILPEFSYNENGIAREHAAYSVKSIREIFETLGDEDNYPIFFHCNWGADRTGTLAFLINGVLGVPYEDLTKDFELTSFSQSGARYRSAIKYDAFVEGGIMQDDTSNYVAWGQLYEFMMDNYGTEDGTLQSAIENYLITVCDVEQEDIDTLRKIMLEE